MIEMLGVLAIIGVLSAGGIMGYTAAMENYRVNKFIDDVQTMSASTASFFTRYPQNTNTIYLWGSQLRAIGVLPEAYYKTETGACTGISNCLYKTPFGAMSEIYVGIKALHDALKGSIWFSVWIRKPTTSQCVKLVTHKWHNFGAVMAGFETGIVEQTLPLSVDQAKENCALINNESENRIENSLKLWFILKPRGS